MLTMWQGHETHVKILFSGWEGTFSILSTHVAYLKSELSLAISFKKHATMYFNCLSRFLHA